MAWTEKYVTADAAGGGDGSSGSPWTLTEALADTNRLYRYNIKAGTYSRTTTVDQPGTDGTTAEPRWFRGYNTTIGDCDTPGHGLTLPLITYSSGRLRPLCQYTTFSSLKITGTGTSGVLDLGGDYVRTILDCVVENTGTSAGCVAIAHAVAYSDAVLRSHLKAANQNVVSIANGRSACYIGNLIEGGDNGIVIGTTTTGLLLAFNLLIDQANDGVLLNNVASGGISLRNTFRGQGGSAINLSAVLGGGSGYRFLSIDDIFADATSGYGVENSSGTVQDIHIYHSLLYNCLGLSSAIGDAVVKGSESDSSSPFVDAGSDDYRLTATSNGRGNAFMGRFPGLTFSGYGDIGAVQRIGTASGLGLTAGVLKNAETVDDVTGTLPILGRATGSATLAKETGAGARGGSGSAIKLTPTSESTYGYLDLAVYVTGNAGKLSFYYKSFKDGASSFNGTVKVSMWDSDDPVESPPPLLASVDISGTYDETDWYQWQSASKTHAAEGLARIRFEIVDGTNNGGIYIDDIAWTDD